MNVKQTIRRAGVSVAAAGIVIGGAASVSVATASAAPVVPSVSSTFVVPVNDEDDAFELDAEDFFVQEFGPNWRAILGIAEWGDD